jgi:folate-binding protein YgfZ
MSSPDPYEAALDRAIIVDRSPRGIVAVTGRDRQILLHNLLTNDIASLGPGTGCYAALLTPQGRMISDMRVVALGDRVLVDVEPAAKDDLLRRLDQSIFSEDVRLADRSALAVVRIAGPEAPRILPSLARSLGLDVRTSDAELSAMEEYAAFEWGGNGDPVVVVRDDSLGLTGFDLVLPPEVGDQLMLEAQSQGVMRAGDETVETLRVEAGRPRFLVDMDRDTIPLEAGIESRAISMTKGCYPGQEVIVRVLHRGHGRVARRLVGVVIESESVPAHGDAIVRGEQRVGTITSAVRSPAVGKPIGLGYVRRDDSGPGTTVAVISEGEPLPARVVVLPFRRSDIP